MVCVNVDGTHFRCILHFLSKWHCTKSDEEIFDKWMCINTCLHFGCGGRFDVHSAHTNKEVNDKSMRAWWDYAWKVPLWGNLKSCSIRGLFANCSHVNSSIPPWLNDRIKVYEQLFPSWKSFLLHNQPTSPPPRTRTNVQILIPSIEFISFRFEAASLIAVIKSSSQLSRRNIQLFGEERKLQHEHTTTCKFRYRVCLSVSLIRTLKGRVLNDRRIFQKLKENRAKRREKKKSENNSFEKEIDLTKEPHWSKWCVWRDENVIG